jgi:glutathione S-transferase
MVMRLHAFPASPRGFKVLAAAEHLGADYEYVFCDLFTGEQHQPGFVALNPNRKMPVLEDGDLKLWESNAIIQYLAEKTPNHTLLPANARERADVSRWLFWESTTWDPAFVILLWENLVKGLLLGEGPDAAEVAKGTEKFNAAAAILDAYLADRSFVCGDRLSLADFSLGSALTAMTQAKVSLDPYPNIARWYAALEALPAWNRVRAMQTPPQ